MKQLGKACLAQLLLWVGSQALADDHLEAAEKLFLAECESCHYADDFKAADEASLVKDMEAIRAGSVDHATDLAGLSSEDIDRLAAFFASQ